MLTSLSKLWKPRTEIKELVEIYWKALKGYTEEQITIAAEDCMNTMKYWPKPVDIRSRIPQQRDNGESEEFRMMENMKCFCGHIGLAIEEPKGSKVWRCRECYSGKSNEEYKKRMMDLQEMMRHV